jgi:DNA polymerase epsilon subunit 4
MHSPQDIPDTHQDMCLVQKEAQLLISLATEQFMKNFAQAMLATAERERRSTIAVRDIGIIGRSSDRFLFLQGMPWVSTGIHSH